MTTWHPAKWWRKCIHFEVGDVQVPLKASRLSLFANVAIAKDVVWPWFRELTKNGKMCQLEGWVLVLVGMAYVKVMLFVSFWGHELDMGSRWNDPHDWSLISTNGAMRAWTGPILQQRNEGHAVEGWKWLTNRAEIFYGLPWLLHIYIYIRQFFVTFVGWWKRDPLKGESWPPTGESKGHELNRLVYIYIWYLSGNALKRWKGWGVPAGHRKGHQSENSKGTLQTHTNII